MSSDVSRPVRKVPVLKMGALAIGLVVLAVLLLRGVELRGLVDEGMAAIRHAGPWVFFTAMAVVPAVGAPLAVFTITAGEAFAEQLGMGTVIAISLAVLGFNLTLAYGITRYALRPVLAKMIARYGYTVPVVTPGNALGVALVVRLTPGPPYALQNVILGVAQVPFRLYLLVSWLAVAPWAVGAIVLGKGMFAGNFKVVIAGVGLIVVALVAVQWVRKKYSRRES